AARWLERIAVHDRLPAEAGVPAPPRRQLDVEPDPAPAPQRRRTRLGDRQHQAAFGAGGAAVALLVVAVLDAVVEAQLAAVAAALPAALQGALLLALALGLVEVGEVGVELEGQAEAGGLLGVVGEVQVLVHALADHAGDAQLQRLRRGRAHAALLAAFAALPRRAHDVVAHPVVLADVGHRRGIRALAPDAAAVQA